MNAFRNAEALATQRYDRDQMLSLVHEVTTHFRMPNSFERSKMRAVCRYLADALDRCNGSTLTTLERFRDEVLAEVEGWRRSSRQHLLDLGCTRPDLCADDRSESGHVVRLAR
ncbi:MAG: hypothetical protein DMG76_23320 [Acidobacteria bacterium]|nr:MAG: hypothetical protein DMG76_23320 [Acidobacteriota bacterium]